MLTLLALLAVFLVAKSVPGQLTLSFRPTMLGLGFFRYGAATLGVGLAPFVALAVARGRWSRHRLDAAIGLAVWLFIYRGEISDLITTGRVPGVLAGNILGRLRAPGGVGAGYRPPLFDSPLWDVLNLVGMLAIIVGLAIATAAIGDRLRRPGGLSPAGLLRSAGSPTGMLVVFVAVYATGIGVYAAGSPLYDRYVWPLVLPIAGLLLRVGPRAAPTVPLRAIRVGGWITAGATGIVVAVVSTMLVLNGFAFDAAGWRMGEAAVVRGYQPQQVDAGMAWVGWYATGTADLTRSPTGVENWYDAVWPSSAPCAMVSSGPLPIPGFTQLAVTPVTYREYLFLGPEQTLLLYSVPSPGCPPGG